MAASRAVWHADEMPCTRAGDPRGTDLHVPRPVVSEEEVVETCAAFLGRLELQVIDPVARAVAGVEPDYRLGLPNPYRDLESAASPPG